MNTPMEKKREIPIIIKPGEKGLIGIRVELTEKQKRMSEEENKEDIAQYIRDMEKWRSLPSSIGNRRLVNRRKNEKDTFCGANGYIF